MSSVTPAQDQDERSSLFLAGTSSVTQATGKEAYRDFLKTDTWQRLRKRRLMIDAYRCQECGVRASGAVLDVHHLNYDHPWGQETMDDLVTLCREHHYTKHKEPRMTGELATPTEGNPFAHLKHTDERGEHWMGRELVSPAGYASWQNFLPLITKAFDIIAELQGIDAAQSMIMEIHKHVPRGFGKDQEIVDYRLTGYGAYMTMLGSAKPALRHHFAVAARVGELAMSGELAEVVANPPTLAVPDAVLIAAMNSDVTSITPMKNGGIRFNRRRIKAPKNPALAIERPRLFRPPIYAVERLGFQGIETLYISLRREGILSWYNGNSKDGNVFSEEFVANGWGRDTVKPCGPGKRDFYVPEFTDDGIEVIRKRVSV